MVEQTEVNLNVDDGIESSGETSPSGMTSAECCRVLSTALENGLHVLKSNENDEEDDPEQREATNEFVSIMSSSASERSTYLDAIRSHKFQKLHARRLFSSLLPLLKHTIQNEHYVPLSAFEDDESIANNDGNKKNKRDSDVTEASEFTVEPDEASTQALLFIKYSSMIVNAFIYNQIQRRVNTNPDRVYDMIEEVYVIAELLHNNLFSLNSCGREGMSVQREIIAMCESYWKGQFSDREELVTQLIPLLVVKSLNGSATNADIKRLWVMREAMKLLDFQERSTIAELRNLLLKTSTSALYLKNADGRKMIAYLFQLDPSLARDLHHSIRIQIPYSKTSALGAYGEIYSNAWKNVAQERAIDQDAIEEEDDEDEANIIESAIEDALQDLMSGYLHAPTAHFAKNILIVLSSLHSQKSNPLYDSLLYRLYNPILWRALSAANPLVRIHASTILHTTFPLEDPNGGKAHSKEVISKSIEMLTSLLNDNDPKVRIAGCDSAIRILGVCWDIISSDHIRSLLNQIVMKHLNDNSSAAVRIQAVKGITLLLDAPASHGVLRPLLPLVGNHIHDSVERVRLECVRMLIKLKSIQGFKYYHVVSSQHIMSRLAVEGEGLGKPTGPVASALTELLINSFFPKGAKGSDQMRRTLEFINQNPSASKVFYANISMHLEVNYISKLIVMLFKTLKIGIEKEKKKKSTDNASPDDEDESQDGLKVLASNTKLMMGVAETINIVWSSIWDELLEDENKDCLDFIQKSISSLEIIQLCAYYEEFKAQSISASNSSGDENCDHICNNLLRCATFTRIDDMEKFISMMSIRINSNESTNILPYYSVLCSWGMTDKVASTIGRSIESLFHDTSRASRDEWSNSTSVCEDGHISRGKRKYPSILDDNKSEKSLVPDLSTGEQALHVVENMLSGNNQCASLMREQILASEVACSSIENAFSKAVTAAKLIIFQTKKCNNEHDMVVIAKACEIYCRFILHKEAMNHPIKLSSRSKDYLFWISNDVVKALIEVKGTGESVMSSPFQDLNLSRISAIGHRGSEIQPAMSPLPLSSSNLDSSFASMEKRGAGEFVVKTDVSSSAHAQILGTSLVRSAMNVFAEWLLVGVENGDEIINHVKIWCKVIENENLALDANQALFPSMCRLLVLSGKHSLRYDLLGEVLSSFQSLDSGSSGSELLTNTIQKVISMHQSESNDRIKSFMSALIDPKLMKSMHVDFENEESFDEDTFNNDSVFAKSNGWAIIIKTILNNGKTIPTLVQVLLESLSSGSNIDDCMVNFYIKMLGHCCKACPKGKSGNKVTSILQSYMKEDSTLKGCGEGEIKFFLESVAVGN